MNASGLVHRAETFAALHYEAVPLLLPNAWDVLSAGLFSEIGFQAIGTTSAGIAWSAGYEDGQRMPRAEMLKVVRRIAAAASVPVSADIEAGYGLSPRDVGETVKRVLDVGCVGINLEDRRGYDTASLADAASHAARIARARTTAENAGVPLFINARTDVYWYSDVEPARRMDETLARAGLYVSAGADGVFVPGVANQATIATLANGCPAPLNILAQAATPPLRELRALGVARVSVGSGLLRFALAHVRDVAWSLHDGEGGLRMLRHALTYSQANALASRAAMWSDGR